MMALRRKALVAASLAIHLAGLSVHAQLLEPRALTNVPVGMNFGLIGYDYAGGNLLIDPSVPVEDLESRLHTIVAAYVRSIDFFGKSAKIDAVVPFAGGDWTGVVDGVDSARSVTGLGDIRFRLSVNLMGAPSLKASEYRDYDQKTIFGVSLQVFVPTGQYDNDRLINLGTNRFTFRPQLGVSRRWDQWILESYLSAWFFTTNNDFLEGNSLHQDPLLGYKIHLIRNLPKGLWLALDAGYALGGRSEVNDVERETRISTLRFALNLAVPLAQRHTLRLIGTTGVRLERGPDFDGVSLIYQYRWLKD